MLTICSRTVIWRVFLTAEDQLRHRVGGVLIEGRHDVGVGVHVDADVGVAQAFDDAAGFWEAPTA